MTPTVAVLGPGGVGGSLAVRLTLADCRVICVARPEAVLAIRAGGLTLDWLGETLGAWPEASGRLTEGVDLLLVTVKAPGLDDGLDRIKPAAVADAVVLPLLNGLEHVEAIRGRLGRRVVAGSIGLLEAYKTDATHIVQTTAQPVVSIASEDLPRADLERAAELLARAGVEVRIGESEKAVLWEKAARMAALAALTALTQGSVGELRSDPRLRAAVEEACAVATADGVPTASTGQWAMIESMAPTLTTSTARDVAAGRPSELDAIAGAVVRAGRRLGVPTPTLDELLAACRA